MVGVALIGGGYWGANLLRSIRAIPEVSVLEIVERDPARARQLEETYGGCSVGSDLAKALSREDVSAVLLATPASTHMRILEQSLIAKKSVYVEKPLGADTQSAERLGAIAVVNDCIVQVGYLYAFNPLVAAAKQAIDAGSIGDVRHCRAIRANYGPIRTDVSPVMDLMVHDLSMLHVWGVRGIESASVRSHHWLEREQPDSVEAHIVLGGGVTASLTASWLNPFKSREVLVVGSHGAIVMNEMSATDGVTVYSWGELPDYRTDLITDFESFRRTIKTVPHRELPLPDHRETLVLALEAFVNSVINRTESTVGIDFALAVERDARLVEACFSSTD